jgi:hypothetical protein
MSTTLAEFLHTRCRHVDEIDDSLVYKVTPLIAGQFPEARGYDTVHLHEDGTITKHQSEPVVYRDGALARQFAPEI